MNLLTFTKNLQWKPILYQDNSRLSVSSILRSELNNKGLLLLLIEQTKCLKFLLWQAEWMVKVVSTTFWKRRGCNFLEILRHMKCAMNYRDVSGVISTFSDQNEDHCHVFCICGCIPWHNCSWTNRWVAGDLSVKGEFIGIHYFKIYQRSTTQISQVSEVKTMMVQVYTRVSKRIWNRKTMGNLAW